MKKLARSYRAVSPAAIFPAGEATVATAQPPLSLTPAAGRSRAGGPSHPEAGGQPVAFTRSEDGVAVSGRTALAATAKEWGGEAGRVEGWAAAAGTGIPDTERRWRSGAAASGAPPRLGWWVCVSLCVCLAVCVLRAGLRAGPGRIAGEGRGGPRSPVTQV